MKMATKIRPNQLTPKEISRIEAQETFVCVIGSLGFGTVAICAVLELIKVWFL